MHSLLPRFSHLYVERSALGLEDTTRLLARFPRAQVIEIDRYEEIFNRPRQDWRLQKQSTKLILAKRRSDFLYPGSSFTPDFGEKNFFYNTLAMNCLYDCDYCYLQGLYPSANIVLFANTGDYLDATAAALRELGKMYLCLSYDTDLLLFEDLIPYCSRWIEFARSNPALTVEIRTKSANFRAIETIEPVENVVLAWTLSPDHVISRFEPKTPPLTSRIAAARAAIERGWKIRLCFDPILAVDEWQVHYRGLIDTVTRELPVEGIADVSVGVFRMNRDQFRNLKQRRDDSPLLYDRYEVEGQSTTYPAPLREEIFSFMRSRLGEHIPSEKVHIIHMA